jgi:hypothetical protein
VDVGGDKNMLDLGIGMVDIAKDAKVELFFGFGVVSQNITPHEDKKKEPRARKERGRERISMFAASKI